MSDISKFAEIELDKVLTFESYGVVVSLESNDEMLLKAAAEVSTKCLAGNLRFFEGEAIPRFRYRIAKDAAGNFLISEDGRDGLVLRRVEAIFDYFDRLLGIRVAEFAEDRVFLHAGAVCWMGKAIIIPADSGKGKTTLVKALVEAGAEYLSDEHAILDEEGWVYPFLRELKFRSNVNGQYRQDSVAINDFGGVARSEPTRIGMVLISEYVPGGAWKPEILTTGQGLMELIPHTIPLRVNAEFSLNALKNGLKGAIIARSARGEASDAAKNILVFLEEHIN
jgi:hypothetical protein